jgi:hypothetical protein
MKRRRWAGRREGRLGWKKRKGEREGRGFSFSQTPFQTFKI